MKFIFTRIPLFIAISLLLITCQSPVNNQMEEHVDNSWIEEMTIAGMRQGYIEGKFNIKDVVNAYIERIEELDLSGPELNSVLTINPDALQIAEELDSEMAAGKIRGPLHGIPILLKDNIDTHDRMPTTAGSLALINSFPAEDSFVAKKLREAGAVILGKTNLSEWANFRAMMSSSGWSAVAGQTKNPYVLDRNPCGSSSGSGVAVSASLCMVAIGTETNGSIVCPSNNNGIVGIKPTVGLISRSGIIPISYTQDTPGPMGRTVEDVAITLGSLTGEDISDPKTSLSKGKCLADYTTFLKKDGLRGKRIGLLRKSMGFSDKVDSLMNKAIAFMKTNGAEIIEIEIPQKYEDASFQVLLYEFKDGLNKYLARLDDSVQVKDLKGLIAFNKKDTVELRYFDQKLFELSEKKGNLDEAGYKKALEKMLKATRENGIDKIMNMHNLDAIIAPTGSPAWKTDLLLGDHYIGGSSSLAAISGYPAITVPMGFVDNLPVGITFFGKAWSEGMLIELAYSYEQGTKNRRAPKYFITD
jgi:amidase